MVMRTFRAKFSVWFTDTFVPFVFPRINPVARWLLKSRLHPLVSWYVVLLHFEGRKTGKRYEVPLGFHRSRDGTLQSVTSPRRRWWRNLRGVNKVSVSFKGRKRRARVEVIEDDMPAIASALRSRDLCMRILVHAEPHDTVLVRIHLLPELDRLE